MVEHPTSISATRSTKPPRATQAHARQRQALLLISSTWGTWGTAPRVMWLYYSLAYLVLALALAAYTKLVIQPVLDKWA